MGGLSHLAVLDSRLEAGAATDRQRRVFHEARVFLGAAAEPEARALGRDDAARVLAVGTKTNARPLYVAKGRVRVARRHAREPDESGEGGQREAEALEKLSDPAHGAAFWWEPAGGPV
jgi:hypothetical protein